VVENDENPLTSCSCRIGNQLCSAHLANDLHLPLVCVGTNEAKQALMTDQQLADRFEARELAPGVTTPPFTNFWPALDQRCRFGELLPSAKRGCANAFFT
jgi:hypothetical protein